MLVIHIGPRKTGTTYLQSNFNRNRKALLARGWLYPRLALKVPSAHHEVVAAREQIAAGSGPMVDRLERTRDLAARRKVNILLSSENFRKWKPADFLMLGERLGQSEITIAYTLRDPVSLLPSIWGETVKNGRTLSLPDFVEKNLGDPFASSNLNALKEIEPILKTPGLSVRVLNYEALRRTRADLYSAFALHMLGLGGMNPAPLRRTNSSHSIERTEFMRLLSSRMGYDPKDKILMFSRQFEADHSAREIAAIEEAVRRHGGEAKRSVKISRDESWYGELANRIRDRLGDALRPEAPDEPLFLTGTDDLVCYDIEALENIAEVDRLVGEAESRMVASRRPFRRSPMMMMWRSFRRRLSI